MRISRIATPIVAALCGLFLAAPASAQPSYPPDPAKLRVSPGVIEEGDKVKVTGRNFGANEEVVLTVRISELDDNGRAGAVGVAPDRSLDGVAEAGKAGPADVARRDNDHHFRKVVETDSDGFFTTRIRLNEEGIARIKAVGRESGDTAWARVIVLCDDDDDDHRHHRGHGRTPSDQLSAPKGTTAQQAGVSRQAPALESAKVQPAASRSWVRLAAGTLAGAGVTAVGAAFRW